MIKNEIILESNDNKVSGIFWQAENAVAITILVHGFGEHISRYNHVAQFFVEANISVLGVDLIGHGNSEGRRGHVDSIEDYYNCIDSMIQHAKSDGNNLPLILYGHSMGGNVVLNYLINRDQNTFCCALATSPWLKLAMQPTAIQLFLAKTMNSIYPKLQQSGGLDITQISSVADVQTDYENDSLNHDKISVRLFNEIYNNGLLAIENAAKISIPLLVAHGDADEITSCSASKEFINNSTATGKWWPGLRHETHNEHNKEEVISFYIEWVKNNLYK
jgi:alpha-beta hydrolase superfamily lysophospholipase